VTARAELSRLSLNQRTTASWSLPEAVQGCVGAGLGAIGIWREQLAEVGLDEARRLVAESGLRVSSLCRGGFFTTADPVEAQAAEARNREAIKEAAALKAAALVLVAGGLPPGDRDLKAARERASASIERLVPYARAADVTLGIEPMNPIYAADRGVISTLAQALDIAERFDPADVGVVVDTFHLWWEPAAACRKSNRQLSDLRLDYPTTSGHSAGAGHDGRRTRRLRCIHPFGRVGRIPRRRRGRDLQRRAMGGTTGRGPRPNGGALP
jgi:sugar phosphate isomerase/epimerase